jgi:hypothetical protein
MRTTTSVQKTLGLQFTLGCPGAGSLAGCIGRLIAMTGRVFHPLVTKSPYRGMCG